MYGLLGDMKLNDDMVTACVSVTVFQQDLDKSAVHDAVTNAADCDKQCIADRSWRIGEYAGIHGDCHSESAADQIQSVLL